MGNWLTLPSTTISQTIQTFEEHADCREKSISFSSELSEYCKTLPSYVKTNRTSTTDFKEFFMEICLSANCSTKDIDRTSLYNFISRKTNDVEPTYNISIVFVS